MTYGVDSSDGQVLASEVSESYVRARKYAQTLANRRQEIVWLYQEGVWNVAEKIEPRMIP